MPTAETLLLVEDDSGIRESVAECLHAEGFEVFAASNGEEALAWLRGGGRPRLVILDLVMPVLNGAQFLEALRADPAHRALPVVLMTAAMPSPGLPLPKVDGYLPKPFELSDLLEAVARFVPRGARRAPGER